jgi:tetratricopeptide (TPR) repeat protein
VTFENFITQAWSEHAECPAVVAEKLVGAIDMIESVDQVPPLVQLITHIYGDHLGQWEDGLKLLAEISKQDGVRANTETEMSIRRARAVFLTAADALDTLEEFSLSDQIRIFAGAAGALCSQGNYDRGSRFLKIALSKVKANLPKGDPAYRAVAVTANNLASSLAEKVDRSNDETELMLMAATAGRTYWEIAGTWLEVERAECRLATVHLAAGQLDTALQHAQMALEICETHRAPPDEIFWAYEAIARIEFARGNRDSQAFKRAEELIERMGPESRTWCEPSFKKLQTILGNQPS